MWVPDPTFSVMSHKNVTKVVRYILVQLSSLNNTMSMVSGVSVQVSGFVAFARWLLASGFSRFVNWSNGQIV